MKLEEKLTPKRSLEEIMKFWEKPRVLSWEQHEKLAKKLGMELNDIPSCDDNFKFISLRVPTKKDFWTRDISRKDLPKIWNIFLLKIEEWYYKIYNPNGKITNKLSKTNATEEDQLPNWFKKLPDGPYGKLFHDERHNATLEPDTKAEATLVASISDHINGGNKLSSVEAQQIKNVLSKGLYKDLILPPNVSEVVRGMALTAQQFSKFIGIPLEKLNFIGSAKPKKPLVFKPIKGASSSWTRDKKVAEKFSRTNSEDNVGMFIWLYLFAKTDSNPNCFFDLQKWYNEVDKEFKNEKEIVGLGDIIVDRLEWKVYQ